jgi:hypothetical protein
MPEMSKQILLDARVFMGGVDLSGSGNKIEIGEEAEAKKTTNWRSGGAHENIAGLTAVDISAEGQWEAGSLAYVDDGLWAGRRALEPWTVASDSLSDLSTGSTVYLTKALRKKASWLGQLGEVASWQADASGTWPLVRGVVGHASGVPRTATGSGTSLQVGAVPSGKYMYANLHVLSISGTSTPTITVKIQSDNATGFPSATDQGSFTAATAIGGQSIRIAGPITDDWWRASWTISGSSPSFLFLVSLGIER